MKVEVFEMRLGMYKVIRVANVTQQQCDQIATCILKRGGVIKQNNVFELPSPFLIPMVRELETKLNIKFYEQKPRG